VWFTLWWVTAVSAPLIWFALVEPAEAVVSESPPVAWPTVCATLVLAAVTAARCRVRQRGLRAAVAAGLTVALGYLCLAAAVYRWIIPLEKPPGPVILAALLPAAGAAAAGFPLGRRLFRTSGPRLVVAAVVAVLGALIAPVTVQRGAEFSFAVFPPDGASSTTGSPAVLTLPAAGRWGIYTIEPAPSDPDCRVTPPGTAADRIPIPPARPGADTVPTYRWVAQFDIPAPGVYSVTCAPAAAYVVNRPPVIRGAVAALVHWPVPVVRLLGALPGLLALGGILVRRRRAGRPPLHPDARRAHSSA
jgi:hypothetical protein